MSGADLSDAPLECSCVALGVAHDAQQMNALQHNQTMSQKHWAVAHNHTLTNLELIIGRKFTDSFVFWFWSLNSRRIFTESMRKIWNRYINIIFEKIKEVTNSYFYNADIAGTFYFFTNSSTIQRCNKTKIWLRKKVHGTEKQFLRNAKNGEEN